MHKFKVGDRVRVKTIKELNAEGLLRDGLDSRGGAILSRHGSFSVKVDQKAAIYKGKANDEMIEYLGETATITSIRDKDYYFGYELKFDGEQMTNNWNWYPTLIKSYVPPLPKAKDNLDQFDELI